MIDPTGRLVTFTRDGAAVAAITPRVRGGDAVKGDAPPMVLIDAMPVTPFVGTPDTHRTRINTWRHALKCYGPKTDGGDRQAIALGLAVVATLHMAGPITFPVPSGGGGTAGIYQIVVESMSGPLIDPDTAEPYVIVTTSLTATAYALA